MLVSMNLSAQVKLQPTEDQARALRETLERANAACNYISQWGWAHHTLGQWPLHKALYYDIRERFELTAQIAVRCLAKVADSYKLDHSTMRTFKPHGSIAYDDRILRWFLKEGAVSIWTTAGRQTIPFVCGHRQRELLTNRQGECDLAYLDGQFYLFATCNWDEPTAAEVGDFLGVDLGIVNIATDSEGTVYSGAQVNGLRHRHRRLRARLQSKGTRAARRLLVKRRRKEGRFARHVNHCISKRIVATAQGTGRGIALEDLKGIRIRVTVRRSQRATLHSWSFQQLGSFIQYKARLAGIPVVLVDPRNTSRTCPACGHVSRDNRPSQSRFSCVSCGLAGPADTIAAENIRRGAVNRPYFSPFLGRVGKSCLL